MLISGTNKVINICAIAGGLRRIKASWILTKSSFFRNTKYGKKNSCNPETTRKKETSTIPGSTLLFVIPFVINTSYEDPRKRTPRPQPAVPRAT